MVCDRFDEQWSVLSYMYLPAYQWHNLEREQPDGILNNLNNSMGSINPVRKGLFIFQQERLVCTSNMSATKGTSGLDRLP